MPYKQWVTRTPDSSRCSLPRRAEGVRRRRPRTPQNRPVVEGHHPDRKGTARMDSARGFRGGRRLPQPRRESPGGPPVIPSMRELPRKTRRWEKFQANGSLPMAPFAEALRHRSRRGADPNCTGGATCSDTRSRTPDRVALDVMVPKAGFEPAHPKALPPQDSVSTNSTTSALCELTSAPIIALRNRLLQASPAIRASRRRPPRPREA